MKQWHETLVANLGLRVSGLTLLIVSWSVTARLHQMALTTSPRDATSLMMLLSAITFVCGSAGSALLFVGPGLWETVEISERWRRLPTNDFEASTVLECDSYPLTSEHISQLGA